MCIRRRRDADRWHRHRRRSTTASSALRSRIRSRRSLRRRRSSPTTRLQHDACRTRGTYKVVFLGFPMEAYGDAAAEGRPRHAGDELLQLVSAKVDQHRTQKGRLRAALRSSQYFGGPSESRSKSTPAAPAPLAHCSLTRTIVLAGLVVLFGHVALGLGHRRLFVAELRPVPVPPAHSFLNMLQGYTCCRFRAGGWERRAALRAVLKDARVSWAAWPRAQSALNPAGQSGGGVMTRRTVMVLGLAIAIVAAGALIAALMRSAPANSSAQFAPASGDTPPALARHLATLRALPGERR